MVTSLELKWNIPECVHADVNNPRNQILDSVGRCVMWDLKPEYAAHFVKLHNDYIDQQLKQTNAGGVAMKEPKAKCHRSGCIGKPEMKGNGDFGFYVQCNKCGLRSDDKASGQARIVWASWIGMKENKYCE